MSCSPYPNTCTPAATLPRTNRTQTPHLAQALGTTTRRTGSFGS